MLIPNTTRPANWKKPRASKGTIGGKTSKTAVVPGFCKIQRRHAYIGVLSEAPVVP